jgi:hypothetical protein
MASAATMEAPTRAIRPMLITISIKFWNVVLLLPTFTSVRLKTK